MDRPDASIEFERFLIARQREYTRESRTAIASCLVMIAVTAFGNWPMLQVVTAILGCVRGFAAYFIIRHQRMFQAREELEIILTRDSAFVKSAVYWYALPLSLGLAALAESSGR